MPVYTTVPNHNPGDTMPSADWNVIANNLNNGGVMRMLADTTLGVAAASIDFTSIPATFAHLLLVLIGRGDAVLTEVDVLLRFNGDSGANYDDQGVGNNAATTAFAFQDSAATAIKIGSITAASSTASTPGAIRAEIPQYAGAVFHKVAVAVDGRFDDTAGTYRVAARAGRWRSAVAANRVTLLPASGNFIIGTRATLYGLPQ